MELVEFKNALSENELDQVVDKVTDFLLTSEERDIDLMKIAVENLRKVYAHRQFFQTYRHKYSKITSRIIFLEKEYEKNIEGQMKSRPIDILESNLELFEATYVEIIQDESETISVNSYPEQQDIRMVSIAEEKQNMFRYIDHIRLEVARIKTLIDPLKERSNEMETILKGLEKKSMNISKEVMKAKNALVRSKQDVIAALSIFAGIVLTFGGSISFTNSLFSSYVNGSDIVVLVILGLTCGLVTVNVLYISYKFLYKLIFSEDSSSKESQKIFLFNVLGFISLFSLIIFSNLNS